MARPVEFEYEKVLNHAMEQFWKEGYEASSVQKLLDCTGINRGTLYNSFGDKDTFFRICVEHYNQALAQKVSASLGNPALAPWDAIARFFALAVTEASNKHRGMGCILVNSLCESINYDTDMKKLLRTSLNNIRKALVGRLNEANSKGKLRKGVTVEFAADVLMNTLHGLRVSSREGKDVKHLSQLIDFSIDSLGKK